MKKPRKICFEITPGRVIATVLVAATLVNLVIVGAVFDASASAPASTSTSSPVLGAQTEIFPLPTIVRATATSTFQIPITGPTGTASLTPTQTPTSTETQTATATSTNTPSPTATACIAISYWPVYIVRSGDTLYAIGLATGTSLTELMQANCLTSFQIYPGQQLRVRRLPVNTPTYTPSLPADTPTEFKLAEILNCDPSYYVSLAVTVYDPQDVLSVVARFYTGNGTPIDQLTMQRDGDTFYGSGSISPNYTVYQIDHYTFVAVDGLQNVTVSEAYFEQSSSCLSTAGFHSSGIQ